MAESMKVNMLTIKKKEKVFSSGQMEESTRVVGKTVNNMVLVLTPLQVVKQSKESGKKEKDSTGFKTNETIFNQYKFKILRIIKD